MTSNFFLISHICMSLILVLPVETFESLFAIPYFFRLIVKVNSIVCF